MQHSATPTGGDPEEDDLRRHLLGVTELLEGIASSTILIDCLSSEERTRLLNAAGDVFCDDPEARRIRIKARRRKRRNDKLARDEARLSETGIRSLRQKPVYTTPNAFAPTEFEACDVETAETVHTADPQHCYICKTHFHEVHHFYDQMCPACAAFNFAKRSELADLGGSVALLTGGRVKIGYQAGIKLLRCGATLIVTTRFPRDAAARFAAEEDFGDWGDRLEIFGLDLRHTPSVEAFCAHLLRTRDRLDFIVNNACQTVRRPPDFYRHMMEAESAHVDELRPEILALVGSYELLRRSLPSVDQPVPAIADAGLPIGLVESASRSQIALLPGDLGLPSSLFPEGQLDADAQQVDRRERNSWRLLMHEVSSVELLETQLVNAVAPFVLNARLKPLMERTPGTHKHIVNVSAVEGQFYRRFKTTRHPHTNMAKAALNMMTRTAATDYRASGIHMNSVDTGWVSDEDPIAIADRKQAEHGFHPPLDIVDGAARIVDPIIDGVNTGVHQWGQFLKDYRPTDW